MYHLSYCFPIFALICPQFAVIETPNKVKYNFDRLFACENYCLSLANHRARSEKVSMTAN